MIAIVNITQPATGPHTYSVRINRQEICQFDHKREDGLSACLLAAAKAVELQRWANAAELQRYIEVTQ